MKYQAEIDGLRAIAVISVIFFHAKVPFFSGGFVGVDVFLVISGYLITAILLAQMEQGTFSLLKFYERRARRILPVLFLVMFVSLGLAWLWLPPADMKDFAHSLVATSYFSSNILFWLESGYWDTASDLKPLLHTWTLAIEAQYYLFFPLFLLLLWRWQKRWIVGALIVTTAISFAGSQWAAYHLPGANFFLLPTRAWEIALGAVLAWIYTYSQQTINQIRAARWAREALSLAGLLLIGWAVVMFDETVPFPSAFALAPTLGTVLVIVAASPQTLVGRLLSTRLLVGIGLISYSAYLWHHPLLVFARHRSLSEPKGALVAALIMLSFGLAYLSWKYIEQPFRSSALIPRKTLFIAWLVGSVVLIEVGVAGHLANGFAGRLANQPSAVSTLEPIQLNVGETMGSQYMAEQMQLNTAAPIAIAPSKRYNYGLSAACDRTFTLAPECRTSNEPDILVWGDSFAMQVVPGILASNPDAKLIQMTMSVCGPFFDAAPISEPDFPVSWAQGCLDFTSQVREWLKNNYTIKYTVLSSPFSQYILSDARLLLRSGEIRDASLAWAIAEFQKTLAELKSLGIQPIVFSPPPDNGLDLGRCLARAEWMGDWAGSL
jgi:peptidoglycan/LPS O-acetylase OafA/YrhL